MMKSNSSFGGGRVSATALPLLEAEEIRDQAINRAKEACMRRKKITIKTIK